jgi:nicotinate-nucleotide adenylyltransferase
VKTIGIYGGSFDPIHLGHLNLALELLERCQLDEVLFCPVFCSPFKLALPPIASPEHRLAMLTAALEGIPQFQITPVEIERGGSSFTVDTLRLLSQNKNARYRLLLSEETAAHLHLWKEPQEILRLAPPLIGTRSGGQLLEASPLKNQLIKNLVQTPLFDIQSTQIRERLKKKLYCGHLVPHKALDYIYKHQLYLNGK